VVVGWERESEGAKDADLRALESVVGASLPADYRVFLQDRNGGEPAQNTFSIPSADNQSGVNEFMSVRQIRDELTAYGDRLPRRTIPIAYAEGGNLVLLALDDGRVSFWDHELEDTDPVFPLAADFRAFQASLQPFDPSTVELKPGQVKRAWIDPDLLT